MANKSVIGQQLPLGMVGSTVFGRYPLISVEQTFNMIISDGYLVPYAGYVLATTINPNSIQGRGLFSSTNFNHLITVVDDRVYSVDVNLQVRLIGQLLTNSGDVYIAENNANQIAICDQQNIYIFNTATNAFSLITTDFTPSYVAFQDTRFVAGVANSASWRLSGNNDGTSWPFDAAHVGAFQTKPDNVVATLPIPGKSNLLFVMGENVTEMWFDVGAPNFPYQKNTSFNIDYGCVNAATIAYLDEVIVWLAQNENSGPVLMVSTGGDPQKISNDGIDFQLASLKNPEDSYGFLFRQDGHLIYQITFHSDNLTYAFDFNTKKFFSITDAQMNYHLAKRIVFFNNTYYFISFVDGNLYEFSTKYTTGNGNELPRIRICPTTILPGLRRFIVNNLTFNIEQGIDNNVRSVDVSASYDGGYTFGSAYRYNLFQQSHFANTLDMYQLGCTNKFTPQFRFWSNGRFVIGDGSLEVYQ
jgi:hypothetical protein